MQSGSSDSDDCASVLATIGIATSRRLAAFLEPTALTARTMHVLLALREQSRSQTDLARLLAVHPVSLVSILNDLESAGLTLRKRDPHDRRRHTVTLSELGRARLAAVDIAREKLDAALFAGMTATQKVALSALLEQIAKNLAS